MIPLSCIGVREYFRNRPIQDSEYLEVFKFVFWISLSFVVLGYTIKFLYSILDYIANKRIERVFASRESGISPTLKSDSEIYPEKQGEKDKKGNRGVDEKKVSESENIRYKKELWDLYFNDLKEFDVRIDQSGNKEFINISEDERAEQTNNWIDRIGKSYDGNFILAFSELSGNFKK
jgi:hypothetical protein